MRFSHLSHSIDCPLIDPLTVIKCLTNLKKTWLNNTKTSICIFYYLMKKEKIQPEKMSTENFKIKKFEFDDFPDPKSQYRRNSTTRLLRRLLVVRARCPKRQTHAQTSRPERTPEFDCCRCRRQSRSLARRPQLREAVSVDRCESLPYRWSSMESNRDYKP